MLHDRYWTIRTQTNDYTAIGEAFARYMRDVESMVSVMPPALHELAVASWHYDPRDRRSLHDMRLRSVTVREGNADDPESSGLSVTLVLLGAYFDRELTLQYEGVRRYQVGLPADAHEHLEGSQGDLLNDEVAVWPQGGVVHALEFSRGSVFEIAFEGSFAYTFTDLPTTPE